MNKDPAAPFRATAVWLLLDACVAANTSDRGINNTNTTMTSRDYTKEVGITSHKKTLSRPVAFIILAIVAVGVVFGVGAVIAQTKENHAAEKARAGSSAAAPVSVAPVPEPAPAK